MITRSNVTEQIVQYFKDNITAGIWRVGEKIPSENQLTETLGVSRASIRTAIRYLIGLGVLKSQQGRGTFLLDNTVDESIASSYRVTAKDCRDIVKVLEFRRIVESEACRMAAQNVTPGLLEELQKTLDGMISNTEDDERFISEDIEFHKAICAATENPILEKSVIRMFEEMYRQQRQIHSLFGVKDGIYYHTLILEAIRGGNGERAHDLMYEHLQSAIDRLRTLN